MMTVALQGMIYLNICKENIRILFKQSKVYPNISQFVTMFVTINIWPGQQRKSVNNDTLKRTFFLLDQTSFVERKKSKELVFKRKHSKLLDFYSYNESVNLNNVFINSFMALAMSKTVEIKLNISLMLYFFYNSGWEGFELANVEPKS